MTGAEYFERNWRMNDLHDEWEGFWTWGERGANQFRWGDKPTHGKVTTKFTHRLIPFAQTIDFVEIPKSQQNVLHLQQRSCGGIDTQTQQANAAPVHETM